MQILPINQNPSDLPFLQRVLPNRITLVAGAIFALLALVVVLGYRFLFKAKQEPAKPAPQAPSPNPAQAVSPQQAAPALQPAPQLPIAAPVHLLPSPNPVPAAPLQQRVAAQPGPQPLVAAQATSPQLLAQSSAHVDTTPGPELPMDVWKVILAHATVKELASVAPDGKKLGIENALKLLIKTARTCRIFYEGLSGFILEYRTVWNADTLLTGFDFSPMAADPLKKGWRKEDLTVLTDVEKNPWHRKGLIRFKIVKGTIFMDPTNFSANELTLAAQIFVAKYQAFIVLNDPSPLSEEHKRMIVSILKELNRRVQNSGWEAEARSALHRLGKPIPIQNQSYNQPNLFFEIVKKYTGCDLAPLL